MSKKVRITVNVIYYLITFAIGFIIAIVLPGALVTGKVPTYVNAYLNRGDYSDAMSLLGGYYDERNVYQETFGDGAGIVIFKAATLEENPKGSSQSYSMNLVYAGFLYNLKDEKNNDKKKYTIKVLSNLEEDNDGNKTRLVVNDTTKIDLLNYDSNDDGKYDSISTMESLEFIYFEIKSSEADVISKLEFIDGEDNSYQVINLPDLKFDDDFFISLNDFVTTYNANSGDKSLKDLEKAVLENEHYKRANGEKAYKDSNKDAAIIVLIYFICIYVFGDCTFGFKFIPRFFKWLIGLFRKKNKEDEPKEEITNKENKDYYTMLYFKLEVPNNFEEVIRVTYHNENDDIEMIFNKNTNYQFQQRIKAGTYVNAFVEANNIELLNLPKELNVRGLTMRVSVNVSVKEEKVES